MDGQSFSCQCCMHAGVAGSRRRGRPVCANPRSPLHGQARLTSVTPLDSDVGTHAMTAKPSENSSGWKGMASAKKPHSGVRNRIDSMPAGDTAIPGWLWGLQHKLRMLHCWHRHTSSPAVGRPLRGTGECKAVLPPLLLHPHLLPHLAHRTGWPSMPSERSSAHWCPE